MKIVTTLLLIVMFTITPSTYSAVDFTFDNISPNTDESISGDVTSSSGTPVVHFIGSSINHIIATVSGVDIDGDLTYDTFTLEIAVDAASTNGLVRAGNNQWGDMTNSANASLQPVGDSLSFRLVGISGQSSSGRDYHLNSFEFIEIQEVLLDAGCRVNIKTDLKPPYEYTHDASDVIPINGKNSFTVRATDDAFKLRNLKFSAQVTTEIVWEANGAGSDDFAVNLADSEAQVDDAITAARDYLNQNPTDKLVLYFPAGEYNFIDNGSTIQLKVSGFNNGSLEIRGEGSHATKFIFETKYGNSRSLDIRNGQNVKISSLRLLISEVATIQGTVLSVDRTGTDPEVIKFELDTGFPDPVALFDAIDNSRFEIAFFEFDDAGSEPVSTGDTNKIRISNMISLGAGIFESSMLYSDQEHRLATGDRIAMKAKVEAGGGLYFLNMDNISVEDVLFTGVGANPIMLRNVNGAHVAGVRIDRADPINGNVPYLSSPYGGIQLMDANDVLIEDTIIVSTADDAIGVFNGQSSNVLIQSCVINNNHGRAFYLSGITHALIQDNTLIRMLEPASLICAKVPATGTSDVTIQYNTIIEPWSTPTFCFRANDYVVNNIAIIGNRIMRASSSNPVLYVTKADNVELSDTELLSFSGELDYPWDSNALVCVDSDVTNVTGGDNSYREDLPVGMGLMDADPAATGISVDWKRADETTQVFTVTDDSYVSDLEQNANFGSDSRMKIHNAADRQLQALVKFNVDLSLIPSGNEIEFAYLRFSPCNISLPLRDIEVYTTTENNWNENGIKWNNRPTVGTVYNQPSTESYIAGDIVEVDITNLIGQGGEISFYLHNKLGSPISEISTKENNIFLAPELVIYHNPL